MLSVERLEKRYFARSWSRAPTFTLTADFSVDKPRTIGVMGPNGSGKTTLFELLTGSNQPTAGRVLIDGRDVHRVRYGERDRLAIHYHQSYQVRKYRKRLPSFMLDPAGRTRPLVHLFDEPQFALQDGYVGFMLSFFRKLRDEGHIVFLCVHPNEPFHLDIVREACEAFVFVRAGRLRQFETFASLIADADVRGYLSRLAPNP
ncbi:MAG TPA: ATP-binding cassette domain-containing protein [Casimicrobiaceae bacterium]|nr:ATP-binding cassette domain-containing protein [Casimicrobiaceae bacterium]